MFEDCVSGSTDQAHKLIPFLKNPLDQDEDLGVKNAIGSDKLTDLILRWADSNSVRRKLEVARHYLKPAEKVIVERVLGVPSKLQGKVQSSSNSGKGKAIQGTIWSDDDTDDDDGAGRTAHMLFASQAGIDENETRWWVSSPASQKSGTRESQSSPFNAGPNQPGPSNAALPQQIPHNMLPLTPVSSPMRPTKNTLHHQNPQPPTPTTTRRSRKHVKGFSRKAKEDLGSPIVLRSSSPVHTIFSSPMSKSKSILPEKDAIKFPLKERGNRMFMGCVDLLVPSVPQSDLGDNPSRYQQSELSILHANDTPHSKRLGGRVGRVLSSEVEGSHRNFSLPCRRSSSPQFRSGPPYKRAQRVRDYLQRIEIGERLAESRPDAVAHSYTNKRARLIEKCNKLGAKGSHTQAGQRVTVEGHSSSLKRQSTVVIPDVDDEYDDSGMDWNKSRDLAEAIRAALANGDRIPLPALKCADSQSSQYAFR
jgi:hypothetical protein